MAADCFESSVGLISKSLQSLVKRGYRGDLCPPSIGAREWGVDFEFSGSPSIVVMLGLGLSSSSDDIKAATGDALEALRAITVTESGSSEDLILRSAIACISVADEGDLILKVRRPPSWRGSGCSGLRTTSLSGRPGTRASTACSAVPRRARPEPLASDSAAGPVDSLPGRPTPLPAHVRKTVGRIHKLFAHYLFTSFRTKAQGLVDLESRLNHLKGAELECALGIVSARMAAEGPAAPPTRCVPFTFDKVCALAAHVIALLSMPALAGCHRGTMRDRPAARRLAFLVSQVIGGELERLSA